MESIPEMIPRSMYQGIFARLKLSDIAYRNRTWLPIRYCDTIAAVTDEISSGTTDDIVRSSSRTSRVKRIPAMGALKIPETAPAAPQPTSNVTLR
jgi:hypothetical protein